ncbi:MAG TPA: ABC transporter ATP-binding protein [Solirubrobacteraceae bacterium]|nr:ABC transporter ATP-binding protein [Solirubrobacteraceae bacterium]
MTRAGTAPAAELAPASGAAVALTGLGKRYDRVIALQDVSLSVARGRFLVLLGPSGSGKSTLIRCLAGIEEPTAGEIAIGGRVVAGRGRSVAPERRDLAMVFQDFALWPHMTVRENVVFPLRRRRVGRADAAERARAMLDRVGLARHADRYPHELSGGEQQRVALARALVAKPTLLLFDEPLSSLDANLRERLRIEIGALVREHGATAVYITHDQGEAFAIADEIGVLEAGRLVQHGPPETIYRTPVSPFVARFTGLAGILHGRLVSARRESPKLINVTVPTDDPLRNLDLTATLAQELEPGAAVQLMLRPTAARICNPEARAAALRAIIRDGAYHGRGYDYVLDLGHGVELVGIFDRRHFRRGETVGLYIDPARVLAFSADASVRVAPPSAESLPGPRRTAVDPSAVIPSTFSSPTGRFAS